MCPGQKEPRVKAHVMAAFLGYALWVTLKHLLKRRPAVVPQPSKGGVDNAQPLSLLAAAGEGAILAGQAQPLRECSMAVSGDRVAW